MISRGIRVNCEAMKVDGGALEVRHVTRVERVRRRSETEVGS